ncbi:hypothetical protein FM103_04925 [Corynebacterium xerosis]|nr:hypothetical protein FM103_04925 [Corynebacterium xerosis]
MRRGYRCRSEPRRDRVGDQSRLNRPDGTVPGGEGQITSGERTGSPVGSPS